MSRGSNERRVHPSHRLRSGNGSQEPSIRELIEELLAEGRANAVVDIAERQRLKAESELALERMHKAVEELIVAQAELGDHARAVVFLR
jgi:hypothetical protein